MRLQPAYFNRHIANIGQQVTWRRAYSCSCKDPSTGSPDPRCPFCSGKGQQWIDAVPTVCGVAGQKTQGKWAGMGRWTDGDVVVTVPGDSAMWDIGQFDRVVLLNALERFSLPLIRGAPSERVVGNIASVERVFWIDKARGVTVEGALPTIAAGGGLVWPQTGSPPVGIGYSITGQRFTEYFCYSDLPSSRNEHSGARLPRLVVLRKWDLWGR
jgi:hypothetical protein